MGKSSRKKQQRRTTGDKRHRFNPAQASPKYRTLAEYASFLEREARQTDLYGPFLAERERQKEDTWGVGIRWEDENGELVLNSDGTVPELELLWPEDVWLSTHMMVYCLLQVSGYTEEEMQVVRGMDDTEFGQELSRQAYMFKIAGAWAESRTAYQFTSETWDAVMENFDRTMLDGLVLDDLLPDWCPYVAFPEPICGVRGFWVMHTDQELDEEAYYLPTDTVLSVLCHKLDGSFTRMTFPIAYEPLQLTIDKEMEWLEFDMDPGEVEQQKAVLEAVVKATTFLMLATEKSSVMKPLDTDFVWVPTLYRDVIEEHPENRRKRDVHVKHRHVEAWLVDTPANVVTEMFDSEDKLQRAVRRNAASPEGVGVGSVDDEGDYYLEDDEDEGPVISWEEWTAT